MDPGCAPQRVLSAQVCKRQIRPDGIFGKVTYDKIDNFTRLLYRLAGQLRRFKAAVRRRSKKIENSVKRVTATSTKIKLCLI
jgi:hypothetical protein